MGIVKKSKSLLIYFFRDNGRTSVVTKNAFLSVVFRGLSLVISLLLVPITIRFVGKTDYGIWMTVSVVVGWMSLLDIGLSNGLRNKLVKALSTDDFKLAKTYVSTTYITLGSIFVLAWIVFIFANIYISWTGFFKLDSALEESLKTIMLIIFTYFCLSFLLKTINSILLADQKAGYSSLIDMLGQLFVLAVIYIMSLFLTGSLFYLCIGMCITPIIVAAIFNYFVFKNKYKLISPTFKFFRFWCVKDLMGLSFKFFIIQIAGIIQFQTAHIIIIRSFSPEDVTSYTIALKYFSILFTFFNIILLPFWSAVTEAYHKKDFIWIREMTNKYLKGFFFLTLLGVGMLIISNPVYHIWIDKWVMEDILIPFRLSLWCFFNVVVIMFGSIFVNALNGVGAIRIQFIASMITPVLYILLCIFFISYLNMGVYSIFIAGIIANINGFILAPVQFKKIFIENKRGIWIA